MRIPQLTGTAANDSVTALNAEYLAAEIEDTIVAVSAQVDRYFVTSIPFDRVEEFEAANTETQNKFVEISANAKAPEYSGVDFTASWEAEYVKMFA